MNWLFVLSAVGLGLAYAATPGAVNTEALRRGVTHGAQAAFWVETGSLIGDSLWAVLALTGVALFARSLAAETILGIAGGCFLLRMAWLAIYEAFRRRSADAHISSAKRGDFSTGVVFGVANPVGLAFWSGVGSSVVASGATGAAYIIFFAGFFCGAVLWCFIITAALHWGKHWLGPHAFRWVNLLCGCVLGYFGLRILWLTIQSWAEQHFSTYLNDHRLLLGLRHAD